MTTRKVQSWMWEEACELLDRAERLHRRYFRLGVTSLSAAQWEPPIDIVSMKNEVRISIALPGVAPNHVTLHATDNVLLVDAVRSPPLESGAVIERLEIPYGRFSRRIALPPGRYELLEQAHSHGCLHLRLIRH